MPTARSWFYETPDARPYLLQERVNLTMWMNRLQDVYFVTEQAEPPLRMSADWQGHHVTIEWLPNRWFRLTADGDVAPMIAAFSNALMLPAAFSYNNAAGQVITEWHRDGGEQRWSEIQGNPAFQTPVRLGK